MGLIFLHANVLFSAAYRPDAGLRRLWRLPGVRIITSVYAAEEANRNLDRSGQREDLEELLSSVEIITTAASTDQPLSSTIELPDKDWPILLAAIGAGATHLLTGDFQHFDPYCGESRGGSHPLSRRLFLFENRIARHPYKSFVILYALLELAILDRGIRCVLS